MPKVALAERVFNRVHGFWGKKSCFSGKLQREKLLLCRGRTCAARSCKVNGHLREGRGPGMPGPYNSVGQLQRVHPPAILRRHQAHRRYSGGIGHNRLLPRPAREVLALTSQHDLIKRKASVRL